MFGLEKQKHIAKHFKMRQKSLCLAVELYIATEHKHNLIQYQSVRSSQLFERSRRKWRIYKLFDANLKVSSHKVSVDFVPGKVKSTGSVCIL